MAEIFEISEFIKKKEEKAFSEELYKQGSWQSFSLAIKSYPEFPLMFEGTILVKDYRNNETKFYIPTEKDLKNIIDSGETDKVWFAFFNLIDYTMMNAKIFEPDDLA